MIPWEHLGDAQIPGGGHLRLKRRGAEYAIALDRTELMNSRLSGSEEQLATLAIAKLKRPDPAILIGGLGMGFTLRAALARLGPAAHITAAEIVPEVVEWARGPMADLFAGSLDDPRVTIHVGDVADAMTDATWDAILLDVDNGPDGLSREGNDALYGDAGLGRAAAALRPGGVLAVWSAHAAPAFQARLKRSGLSTEEHTVPARAGTKKRKGATHTVWLGIGR